MDDNAVDDDFSAGFNDEIQGLTETPGSTNGNQDNQVAEEAAKPTDKVAEPEYARITAQELNELKAKAAAIDEIRAEYGKKFDSAFGTIGNLKQLIERVQSSTQSGQQINVTEEDFEELVKEGYPDLAQMNAAALNRILAKAKLTGSAEPGINPEKVGEIFQERFGSESAKLRQSLSEQIRAELAQEAIEEMHPDFTSVVNSQEFKDWTAANKVNEQKDRKGVLFAESMDARFVGKVINDFKASQKQTATRQSRIAAAVQPRGVGGHAGSSTENDEFLNGFNGN